MTEEERRKADNAFYQFMGVARADPVAQALLSRIEPADVDMVAYYVFTNGYSWGSKSRNEN